MTESVEELNDRLAREHPIDDYYEKSPWLIRAIERSRLARIKQIIGDAKGLRLLEVGSGGGHVLRMFPEAKITACDVSSVFLDTARKNLEGYDVTFVRGAIEQLSYPEGSFDRVICTEVLEHTEEPERIMQELARILSPQGVAAITIPNDHLIVGAKRVLKYTPARFVLGPSFNWGGDKYHLHRWSSSEFRALLSQYFEVIADYAEPSALAPVRLCYACRRR